MKRFFAAALSLCMLFSLCGCSSKPETAQEVLTLVNESMKDTSYTLEGSIAMDLSVDVSGLSVGIPIDIQMAGDVMGDNSHANVDVSMEVLGQTVEIPMELYVTADKTYTGTDGSWTVEDASAASAQVTSMADKLMNAEFFANAEMQNEEDTYTIVLPLSSLDPTILAEALPSSEDAPVDQLTALMQNGSLVYVITGSGDDYVPYSITMDGLEGEFEQDGTNYSIAIDMELKFSNFNGVTETDVMVPDEIVQSAVPASEDEEGGSLLPAIVPDEAEGTALEEPVDEDLVEEPVSPSDKLDSYSDVEYTLEDMYAVYNGQVLIPGEISVETFLDEFSYHEEDAGTYMFLPMTFKENDLAEVYLYGTNTQSFDLSAPVYGYDFEYLTGFEEGPLPDVSINGITFYDSEDDVLAVFGEPDYYSTSSSSWNAAYVLEDHVNSTEYTLRFSGDALGVYSMHLEYYHY